MNKPTHPHQEWLTTAGGKIRCQRCQATSKCIKQQCGSPAMHGKRVCRIHGGKSKGPKTDTGRQRCAEARTVHGQETRAFRAKRKQKKAEIKFYGKLLGIEQLIPVSPFSAINVQ